MMAKYLLYTALSVKRFLDRKQVVQEHVIFVQVYLSLHSENVRFRP